MKTMTTNTLDTLRAKTKPCPCLEAEYTDALCRNCGTQGHDNSCDDCHGDGTVPVWGFLWEDCSNRNHFRPEKLPWNEINCVVGCHGTRRVYREPSDAEIEDWLTDLVLKRWGADSYVAMKVYPGHELLVLTELNASPDEWRGEFDLQLEVVGKDPRDCRMKAFLKLAEAK